MHGLRIRTEGKPRVPVTNAQFFEPVVYVYDDDSDDEETTPTPPSTPVCGSPRAQGPVKKRFRTKTNSERNRAVFAPYTTLDELVAFYAE